MTTPPRSRRFFAPEVVQTSAMDCGPASLKCVLDGHGIPVSYARLRDACQTDVDGTSIDTMETVANQLGLAAEQIVIPPDHVLLPAAAALPAIVVVHLSDRMTHFVVLWRRHGRRVQVMDPSGGRRWMTGEQLRRELYLHRSVVPAADWRTWAGSAEFTGALRLRLTALGVAGGDADAAIVRAAGDATWRALATLDAVTRMAQSLVESGGLTKGGEASVVVTRLLEQIAGDPERRVIPERFWSVIPAERDEQAERLTMIGAVLVRFPAGRQVEADGAEPGALAADAVATLHERPPRPVREILAMLRADRALSIPVLLAATALASGAIVVEALLFRSLLDLGHSLGPREQRLGAVAALVAFTLLLTAIELPLASWLFAAGRRLEASLRLRFYTRVPRLGDRYFHSRLTSDIAERVHSLHQIRQLPPLAGRFVRLVCEVIATTAGIIWLDPASSAAALLLAATVVAVPLLFHPALGELELRMRTHAGALSRYYLDALIGLVPIRVHGAERPVRREHGRVLNEWTASGRQLLRVSVAVQAVQTVGGFAIAAWLLWAHLLRGGDATSLLLLYWALRIPVLGDEIALLVRQYPQTRNVMLRLLEPLSAPASAAPQTDARSTDAAPVAGGVRIAMHDVEVHAAGRMLLRDVNIQIASGEHIAIVGPSGAGKSTFAGLLLGWHTAASGSLHLDGRLLDDAGVERLRGSTAWVDPAVHLWNRSLLDNLHYGNPPHARPGSGFAVTAADLQGLVEKLPDGLQTTLGEGGALVSGGEGQRVRLGRALLRPGVRLAVLDEPFRGLDRATRRDLLALVREHWRAATLLCISHDVTETQSFDRVLVIDGGVIVEDAAPRALLERPSRYRELLAAEREVHAQLWASPVWRRTRIEGGRLVEEAQGEVA